jgi:hypothetical protein
MNRSMLLGTAALVALMAGNVQAGHHPYAAARATNLQPYRVAAKVLYNQNSNFGEGIVSQDFTGGSSTSYSSAGADDFVIPAGRKWQITEVDATGLYFNGSGPAASEVITFYSDRKGYPGNVKGTFPLNCTDDRGVFTCKLPGKGQILTGGSSGKAYWVSVVANCDFFSGCGEWGWVQNTKIRHFEGVWENPWNGYDTGCTTWGRNSACLGLPGDYAFSLIGKKF